MLFQMIGGRPPFDADTLMDVLLGHLAEPLPELTSPHGPVPESVVAIVRKATAKTVADALPERGGDGAGSAEGHEHALVAEGVT